MPKTLLSKSVPRARDALAQLELDHQAMRRLLLTSAVHARAGEAEACAHALDQLCDALSLQLQIEEDLIHPLLRQALGEQASPVGALGEHARLRALIARVDELIPGDAACGSLVQALAHALQPNQVLAQSLLLAQLRDDGLDTRVLGEQMNQCRRRHHHLQPAQRPAAKAHTAWPPAFRLTMAC